ncbi:MAG: glycosyltransferase family 4 protein [Acidimicrobiia bacterium]
MLPLRVGVNLCWLVPGVVGGSEYLLVDWLRAVAEHQADRRRPRPALPVAITVFGSGDLRDAHPFLAEAFRFVVAPVGGRAKPLRVGVEASWLPLQQRRLGLSVLHHAGGVVPPVHTGRIVLTVHDIQPLDLPEHFSAVKRRYLAALLPPSVRSAELIVTTSAFVVDRLVERLGAERDRCRVVAPVLHRRSAPDAARVAEVRSRLGLPEHYVLYPAIAYPHKNHRVLLDALALLHRRGGPAGALHLVLTGAPGPLDAELDAAARAAGIAAAVHRLGRLARTEFEAVVAGADALAFPSTYEGFGLGAFDALAAGAPTVAADIPPLREVLGPDARLLDPHDPPAWADALERVATSDAHRRELASASVARAGCFDAARSAQALLDAYRDAHLGRPQPSRRSPRPLGDRSQRP